MTSPDNTTSSGPQPSTGEESAVRGGSPDRMDPPDPGSGGVAGGGADGETAAREQLRKDLGERSDDAGTEAP
ncbi:MAG: hypothetical protein WD794_12925 [Mycobacteriales bacterium]